MIDLLTHDAQTDVVTLTMGEARPWSGEPEQLFQLQEKLNAYVSFALDGEMEEAYPGLVGKPLCLRLECLTEPDSLTGQMLEAVRRQLSFQEIALEVVVQGEGSCGHGCGCA